MKGNDMVIREYDPSTLGPIDAVDVVALDASVTVSSVGEFIRSTAALGEIRLTGVDAERIAALWRALPPSDQARCHIPPYGLRFWFSGRKLIDASICWQCNNVYGYAGDERLYFGFDAKAPVSVSLLMQCRHVLPRKGN